MSRKPQAQDATPCHDLLLVGDSSPQTPLAVTLGSPEPALSLWLPAHAQGTAWRQKSKVARSSGVGGRDEQGSTGLPGGEAALCNPVVVNARPWTSAA